MCLFVLRVKCMTTVCTELATHPPVYGVPLNARTRAPSLTRVHLRRNKYISGRFVLRGLTARTGCVTFAMASRSGGGGAGPAVQQRHVTVFVGSIPEDKDDKDAYRYQLESGVSP